MPWKYKGTIIKEGKSWSDGTYKHPYNWSSTWSDKDKKDFGLEWEDAPASEQPFNDTFYWGRQSDGTLIERSLTDINEVDENKKPVLDVDGKQVVTKGLKTLWIEKTKETANNMLSNTDWYIIRASDDSSLSVPSDITAKRKAIRDASKTIEDKIAACSKLADFKKLFDTPMKDGIPNGNAPIFDFPEDDL